MSSQFEVNKFYNKCMYKDCENRRSHEKRFYCFPCKTDARFDLWMRNSGNTNLQKWSFSTLRRSGLCEDHFTPDSFNPKSVNKGLKRSAVPIPYNVSNIKKNSKEIGRKRKNSNEEALRVQENINEQSFQESQLKVYKSAHLHFDIPEKEDNMNWINIEPQEPEALVANPHNDTNKKKNVKQNKENDLIKKLNDTEKEINYLKSKYNQLRNDAKKKINSLNSKNIRLQNYAEKKINCLKSENLRLRHIISDLKYRSTQKKKLLKGRKAKEQILKKLINEQDISPVAKAMINLQLHRSNTPYTKEEKNLSKQLYFYSPSAFCCLRKAGCNFPGPRTMRRWMGKQTDTEKDYSEEEIEEEDKKNEKRKKEEGDSWRRGTQYMHGEAREADITADAGAVEAANGAETADGTEVLGDAGAADGVGAAEATDGAVEEVCFEVGLGIGTQNRTPIKVSYKIY